MTATGTNDEALALQTASPLGRHVPIPRRGSIARMGVVLSLLASASSMAQTDFHGIWAPVAELAETWSPADLQLTEQGAAGLAGYDSSQHDSALFCMPLGTPRNTLTTASYPIEILQRPEQITMIFDGRGDVRRIFLDGRSHPEEPIPNWMGHSVGSWQGEELRVDTIAMTTESRLTSTGLPHSEAVRLRESWTLIERAGEALLRIALRIDDPAMYRTPLEATRYYRRAPNAALRETAAECQLDQWRSYLERHSKELSMQLRGLDDASAEAGQ